MKIDPGRVIRLPLLAVILFLGMALTSCLKTKEEFVPSEAALSIVNAYSGTDSLDFYIDNQKVNTHPLLYTQNTEYIQIFSGKRKITLTKSGFPTTVFVDATADLSVHKYYTLYIYRPNSENPHQAESLLMEDNFTSPSSGKAKVRFINLVPDAPTIDVYYRSETGEMLRLFSNSSFKTVSDFIEIDPAIKTYYIGESGEDIEVEAQFSFEAGKVYTVYATGLWDGNGQGEEMLTVQTIVNKKF